VLFSNMSPILSSSKQVPCSTEFTPAVTAFIMPLFPCAWATTCKSLNLASSTITFNSSSVNWGCSGLSLALMTPPVTITLIKSAPLRMTSRTFFLTFSGPSAIPSGRPGYMGLISKPEVSQKSK